MKLQPKLFAGRNRQAQASATATATATATAGVTNEPAKGRSDPNSAIPQSLSPLSQSAAPLRVLGSELQQAALQSTFEYPKTWVQVIKTIAAILLMLAFAHAGLTLIPMTQEVGIAHALLSWDALGLVIETATLSLVAAFLVNSVSALRINPQGLGVSELTGWRTIPWAQVDVVRVMELSGRLGKGRYLVMIPFKGRTVPPTPAPMLKLLPALIGAAREGERGIMLTSDLKNFERLLQLVVSYLVQASNQQSQATNVVVESYVDDDVNMPTAQLLLDPEAALERLSHYTVSTATPDPYGVNEEDTDPPVNWQRMLLRQLPIALLPSLVFFSDVLVHGGDKPNLIWPTFWAGLLLVMGLAELPFVAYLIQAVGELMVGGGKFKRAVWAYADLQVPRALAIVLGLAFLGAGLPSGFAQALWLAGIALTTLLTTRFVQKLYYMPLIHTVLAAIGTFIVQLLILALYFGTR